MNSGLELKIFNCLTEIQTIKKLKCQLQNYP